MLGVAAWGAGLPAAIVGAANAPMWYVVPSVMASALGIGLPGFVLGLFGLAVARHRPDGGVRGAVILALVVGALANAGFFYGHFRQEADAAAAAERERSERVMRPLLQD